jgi:primosomal protein N' (replication factor Y)
MKKIPSNQLRDVAGALDDHALCTTELIHLVMWMSRYYLTPAGVVFEALIPAGVKSLAGTRELTFLTPGPDALDDRLVAELPVKQQSILRHLIAAGQALTPSQLSVAAECTLHPIQSLRKKGMIVSEIRRLLPGGTMGPLHPTILEGPSLMPEQSQALERVLAAIRSEEPRSLLLFGVTGSGKTEVYIRAIRHLQAAGKQAIVLVPEISLTPQTRQRLQDRLGRVTVLHSQMSPTERHFHWQRIAAGEVDVVVGPRSAIFAPVPRLGLIVIDEEHEGSFKQDTAPRYHAREVARQRSQLERVPLLLGSATPSLESWHEAMSGRTELIRLRHRVDLLPLPQVQLIDMRMKSERTTGAISIPLQQAITETLASDGQVILMLNRRGFATNIQCPSCGHVVACPDCDLPLTHHRDGSKAVCHYCDHQIPTPPWCPECKFDGIRYTGMGTQRLEMEVKARFPSTTVARMDSDTMRRPGSHERVLTEFREGRLKILLGTQMIAKGLDFPNVTLVGVINADTALHFPDFRAAERTFQLVTQVSGRTGRSQRGGRVVVQTYTPEHLAIQFASRHDFEGFAIEELKQRERFAYPPLGRLARIIVRGPEEAATEKFSQQIGDQLEALRQKQALSVRILGPAPPPMYKLRGLYRFHLLLQSSEAGVLGPMLRRILADMKPPAAIQFIVDVDPLDML